MFKKSSFKVLGLLATLALAIVLSACGNGDSGSSSDGNTSLVRKMLISLILQAIILHHVH